MKTKEIVYPGIPGHFVDLQAFGFICNNYYAGERGKKMGLSQVFLDRIGFCDERIWVHPDLIEPLKRARQGVMQDGYDIRISDGFRPVALYVQVSRLIASKTPEKRYLINTRDMIHATGMAVDIDLVEADSGKVIWCRNERDHGIDSCRYKFYHERKNRPEFPEARHLAEMQDILFNNFIRAGFRLGTKNEYWHFELLKARESTRFWMDLP